MRSLIAAVFSVATLLSANSGTFAQGAQPGPGPMLGPGATPNPAPSSQSSSEEAPRAWPEPGRYHPCPASVAFGTGRSVCLGLDEPRRHAHAARRSRCWGWPSYSNWSY